MKFPVDELKWVNFLFVGMLVFFVFVFLFFTFYIFIFSSLEIVNRKELVPLFTDGKTKALSNLSPHVFVYKQR